MVAEQTGAAKKEPLAGLMGLPLLHNVTKSLPIGLLQRLLEGMKEELEHYIIP